MGAAMKIAGEKRTIALDNDLTLPHAEAMKKMFLKALVESDDVSIAFEQVRNVDLSVLQLLCSAHRSAARLNKKIAFEGDPPDALREAAARAGYDRTKGCKHDCDGSCLWAAIAGDNNG